MTGLLELRGIVTVLNTPFDQDLEVDSLALRRHARLACDAGVAGFLIPAMASEVDRLNERERLAVAGAVVDEVDGGRVVVGGASRDTPQEAAAAAKALVDLGCDGVLVHVPYSTEEKWREGVEAVARTDPPFLIVQDWAPDGWGIPVEALVAAFEELDCLRGVKVEVVPAGPKYTALLRATGGRLHVSGGWAAAQVIEALDRGVHAFMPTALHRTYVEVYKRYSRGDREGAKELFERLLPVLAFSNQHLDMSIHFFKRLLHHQGIYPTPLVRQPRLPFDEYHERIAAELFEVVDQLEGKVRGE
ncbi:MAG: hypothetical protein Kow0069_31430 [Promethearchaeota archaeon]